ncbi:hypothetical protein ElyMa_004052400 [Elysia marginata]|uniref:Uncharacterized protein n=1 Tax=Elysia marginata TaxID=1093978 RepID=A0AAV4G4S4_9GAST|nr:hypothetical protein ElyMa_004052400 [Elysia marginata]
MAGPPSGPAAPPPDLQLHLVTDYDDMEENMGAGPRRPSTASLSRWDILRIVSCSVWDKIVQIQFRSCPQLAALNSSQDSPGSDMAPMTDSEGNMLHTSPATRNCLYVEQPSLPHPAGGIRSTTNTPTPPSTPGSRRRGYGGGDPMTASFTSRSNSVIHSNNGSPSSSPKLQRRFKLDQEGRTYSADAGASADPFGFPLREDGWQPECCSSRGDGNAKTITRGLSSNNFDDFPDQNLEDERVSMTDDGSSMHVYGRLAHQDQHHRHFGFYQPGNADDSADKCSRWLQSLKLSKADKVKSRSHIQLPPV